MPNDPNLLIAGVAIAGLVLIAFWRVIVWVREAPLKPDPWDAEVEQQLQEPATPEACPHCSTPQSPGAWFCPHCGRAVGPYNNLMPYVLVFSEGEVLRNGTQDRLRKSPVILIGYLLISFNFLVAATALTQTSVIFSLVILGSLLTFWYSLLKNFTRSASGKPDAPSA